MLYRKSCCPGPCCTCTYVGTYILRPIQSCYTKGLGNVTCSFQSKTFTIDLLYTAIYTESLWWMVWSKWYCIWIHLSHFSSLLHSEQSYSAFFHSSKYDARVKSIAVRLTRTLGASSWNRKPEKSSLKKLKWTKQKHQHECLYIGMHACTCN